MLVQARLPVFRQLLWSAFSIFLSPGYRRALPALLLLLMTSARSAFALEQPTFLPANQAFVLSVDYEVGEPLRLQWTIADGYYLYRQQLALLSTVGESPVSEPLNLPVGITREDEWFGVVEVYYNWLELSVPVNDHSGLQNWTLRHQGCADAGLCYPPQYYRISFNPSLSGALATEIEPPAGSLWADDNQQGANNPDELPTASHLAGLLSQGSLSLALAVLFLAGVGLAFTPCVLPMVPILSSIIVSGHRPSSRSAVTLSSAYVLGMAATYTVIGALTGLFGAAVNIQAGLQNPWLLSMVSLAFVLLALSSFGVYSIQLPASLQNWLFRPTASPAGHFGKTALMGAGSSLLVSPCISAPLAGILIYISTWQDVRTGALALFVLALGMGTPLLLMGLGAGRLLPLAGAWMNTIRTVCSIGLLALAIWLMERLLPPSVGLVLWALLAIGVAIWLAYRARSLSSRLALVRAVLAGLLVGYGLILIVGASKGADSLWQPWSPFLASTSPTPEFQPATQQDMNTLLAGRNPAEGPTMLYFSADWCVVCVGLERGTFRHPEVASELASMTLLKADLTKNTAEHRRWLKEFGLFGPPAILLFRSGGEEAKGYRLQGEVATKDLVIHLRRFLAQN